MAKAAWLIPSVESGSGNGSINLTASEHTGRVQRTTTLTVQGTGVTGASEVAVVQSAKPEFVALTNNATEIAVDKDGETVTVTGKSNSSKLKFEWVTPEGKDEPEVDEDGNTSNNGINYPTVTIPSSYTANGATADNDTAITGDPGATAEYDWSIALVFPKNDSIKRVDRTLKITANGAQVAQVVLKQTANSPVLSVSPEAITIPAAGTPAQTVTVTSNTSWTVS